MVSLTIEPNAKEADRLLECNFYEFFFKSKRIGIIESGIGASMAVLILERFIVRGIGRVICTEIAGFIT